MSRAGIQPVVLVLALAGGALLRGSVSGVAYAAAPVRAAALDPAANDARRGAIVVKIGERSVTAGELEDRLATVPRFQLLDFGATSDAIRRAFLEQVVVPEVQAELGAKVRNLVADLALRERLDRALANAAARAIRNALPAPSQLGADEVRAAYESRLARFESPERIQVWRILCRTEAEAKDVLGAAMRDGTVETWKALARDHSIDRATYLRGGNQGFLAADGTSNEPGLRADVAVVAAARGVKDGEFVPAPVREGDAYAIAWRRGTVPAVHRSFVEVEGELRESLVRQHGEEAVKAKLAELRKTKLTARDPSPLETLEVAPPDEALFGRPKAGSHDTPDARAR